MQERAEQAASGKSPLAYRDFRWLWTGSLFSYASHWIQAASMSWVVYDITGSGALLGAILGVRAIPLLALSPLAGVAADRYNRRRLLQSSQIFSALISIVFGAALALDAVGVGSLFAFSLLMGAAGVMDRPARQSMAFELVPRAIAVKAVALNVIGNNLSRVLAPAAAGFLIAWFGVAGNFFIQAACYFIAAAMVLLVVIPPRPPRERELSAMRELLDGLRFAAINPSTRLLLALGVIEFFMLVPALGTLFPIYAKDVFQVGPQGLGLLFTAIGIGGIAGGFVAGLLSRYERTGLIQSVAIALCALCIAWIGLSTSFWMAFAATVFAGLFEILVGACNLAALQMLAPEAMRGRISSLSQLYPAVISLGGFMIGPLADVAGARGASLIAAGLCVTVLAALWLASPRLRELRLK